MKNKLFIVLFVLALAKFGFAQSLPPWTYSATISGITDEYWSYAEADGWDAAVDSMVADGVTVVDIDMSYELQLLACFADTSLRKPILDEIAYLTTLLHSRGIHCFAYIAPLENIELDVDMDDDGKIDPGKVAWSTEHPSWIQKGIDGRRAIFYSCLPGMPFWVPAHSEDVWMCPVNPDYAAEYTTMVRQIVRTEIDAIYVDVPFWCSEFGDGWTEQWPCHCDACAEAFFKDTGLPLPTSVDWESETFRIWVKWRFKKIQDYLRIIKDAIHQVNPNCLLIVEFWDVVPVWFTAPYGVHTGSIIQVTDISTHEFDAELNEYGWYTRLFQYSVYRAFDEFHPSWVLDYADNVDYAKMLALMQATCGMNYWETVPPGMSGCVDRDYRARMFHWLTHWSAELYHPASCADVGVYIDENAVDFGDGREGNDNYTYQLFGTFTILNCSGIPTRMVTANDLPNLTTQGLKVLYVPEQTAIHDSVVAAILAYANEGGTVVAWNNTGVKDEWGTMRTAWPFEVLFGAPFGSFPNDVAIENPYGAGRGIYRQYSYDPTALQYGWALENSDPTEGYRAAFIAEMFPADITPMVEYTPHNDIIVSPYSGDNALYLRVLNLLDAYNDATPTARLSVEFVVHLPEGIDATTVSVMSPYDTDLTPITFESISSVVTFSAPIDQFPLFRLDVPGLAIASRQVRSLILDFKVYPNPVSSITTISYQIPVKSRVALKIYDLSGRLVKTLVDKEQQQGFHNIKWDRKDSLGKSVSSGIYFCKLEVGNKFSQTQKLLLSR